MRRTLHHLRADLATNLLLATLLLAAGLLFTFKPGGADGVSVAAAAGSGREVIDLVNQVRAANGLAPYQVNDALMAAAQGHSEWMAATGNTAHTGEGGSSPAGRAAAAGYLGSGVTENIASGSSMTPAIAVRIWQGDALHLATLLSATSEAAGAGVATSEDGVTYITLDIGGRGGGSGSGSQGSGSQGSSASPGQATPSGGAAAVVTPGPAEAVTGIQTATPKADGSILHTVEQGQTLWSIATSYKISLNDLYALNRLDDQSLIFPGDRLVIRQAGQTLTPTLPVTGTVSITTPGTPAVESLESSAAPASATPRPATRTAVPTEEPAPTRAAAGLAEEQLTDEPGTAPDEEAALQRTGQGGFDPMLLIIGAIALLGAGLMLVGTLLKRSTPD